VAVPVFVILIVVIAVVYNKRNCRTKRTDGSVSAVRSTSKSSVVYNDYY